GVSGDYIAALRLAAPQLGPVSLDDATGMRALGVTPEYIRSLLSTGLRIRSYDDVMGARAVGVNPAYVRSIVSAGYRGDIDDYIALAGMGVTADDVRRIRSTGMPVDMDTLALAKAGRPGPKPHPDPNPNPDPEN
ncbi:MAG TPA: hypothetical protein VN029_09255, partial [Sphingomonas sp.]|nr:hypothetical protein [Sphingomonas sp.]